MIKYAPLLRFMVARHSIYMQRMTGKPFPWTRDPILLEYKFTNVFRELDRGTVYVRDSIRIPYARKPYLWFMLSIARQINHPGTINELIHSDSTHETWPFDDRWNWKTTMRVMRARAARGEQVYTGAYILNAQGMNHPAIRAYKSFDKPLFTCALVLNLPWGDRDALGKTFANAVSLQELHKSFVSYHGWGGFTAYEVVCDMAHCEQWCRIALADQDTWAHAGPGAKRGIMRLLGTKGEGSRWVLALRDDRALYYMRRLHEYIAPRFEKEFGAKYTIHMREIEHSLCEFDKYERTRLGEGRPRSKYRYDPERKTI